MRVVHVVGARPQFVKLSPLLLAFRGRAHSIIVHTGQHYDTTMSAVFFAELGLPTPDHHLGIGSGRHGEQTAAILAGVEAVLLDERPDRVVVLGDTNSTLAGALAAAKLEIPLAHVEAGLRSYNRRMPEEINRVVTDHVSTWLFAPSESAAEQLAREGIVAGVHVVGDIMRDAVIHHGGRAEALNLGQEVAGVPDDGYILATFHRAENTDDPVRLAAVVGSLAALDAPVILPLHPRTRASAERHGVLFSGAIHAIEPVGYLDMLRLLLGSRCVVTDSGGVQKEAFYLGRPCVTLRSETEWTETVEAGWNRLCRPDPALLQAAVDAMSGDLPQPPALYGDGTTAKRIANILLGTA